MKTNRMTRCGAAVAMAALGVGVWAGAATITWTGATSTDWATGSNWTGGPGVQIGRASCRERVYHPV